MVMRLISVLALTLASLLPAAPAAAQAPKEVVIGVLYPFELAAADVVYPLPPWKDRKQRGPPTLRRKSARGGTGPAWPTSHTGRTATATGPGSTARARSIETSPSSRGSARCSRACQRPP